MNPCPARARIIPGMWLANLKRHACSVRSSTRFRHKLCSKQTSSAVQSLPPSRSASLMLGTATRKDVLPPPERWF